MPEHFTPYNSKEPYLFISYAHADTERVLPAARILHERKIRVWYDSGINAGTNWPEIVAGRLADAALAVVFVSEAALRSQNCIREIHFATELKKPMIAIYLENVTPSEGIRMQLSAARRVNAYEMETQEAVADAIEPPDILLGDGVTGYTDVYTSGKRRGNSWRIIAILFAMMFVAAGVLLFGMTRGWFGIRLGAVTTTAQISDSGASSDLIITSWSDPVTRDLLLAQINDGALYICGDAFLSDHSAISYKDGICYAGDTVMPRGTMDDLSPIAEKSGVTDLAIINQAVTDVSALKDMTQLTTLDLSANEITDLSPLETLDKVTVLRIAHIRATDLSVLLDMDSLQRVYVSYDMYGFIADLLDAGFEIVLTD